MHHIEPPALESVGRGSRQAWLKAGLVVGWLVLFAAILGPASLLAWLGASAATLLRTALAICGLLILPGAALLRWLWPDPTLSRPERLALAGGLGMAMPPILLGAAHLIGLPWTSATTVVYAAIALLALLWPARGRPWRTSLRMPRWSLSWHGVVLGGLLGLGLLIRLYVVRDLPVALWTDSYHHTMITQLLLDNHGLFSSWQPYVPLDTLTYHYGFHANSAFFAWLTGMSAAQSVLIIGQIANAATMLMAYLLTTRLSQNPTAGLWAVALTGFVNTLPAYYVNWGRYTQLIGQVLLPIVIVCWMAALEHPRVSWRLIILATLASTSLVLTHYLVAVFAGAFIGLYIVVLIARRPNWKALRHVAIVATGIGLLSGLLWLPWGLNVIQGKIDNIAVNATQEVSSYVANNSTLTGMSPLHVKAPIVLLAFGGTLLALAQRRWRIALCALWTLGFFLLIVPDVVGIPLRGIITSFAAYIALYITVIPLAAYLLGALPQLIQRWQQPITGLSLALLVAISLWGVSWQSGIVNAAPQQLVTPADAKAMDWIRANTPADARFLVNMLPAYADSAFIGDDGGWWIPLLAGRQNTMPPMTYVHERSSIPNYVQQVNDFAWAMQHHPLPSPEGIQLCLDAGLDYIYIGPHMRSTAFKQRIDLQSLRYRPEQFPIVYEQGGVIIFAIAAK